MHLIYKQPFPIWVISYLLTNMSSFSKIDDAYNQDSFSSKFRAKFCSYKFDQSLAVLIYFYPRLTSLKVLRNMFFFLLQFCQTLLYLPVVLIQVPIVSAPVLMWNTVVSVAQHADKYFNQVLNPLTTMF